MHSTFCTSHFCCCCCCCCCRLPVPYQSESSRTHSDRYFQLVLYCISWPLLVACSRTALMWVYTVYIGTCIEHSALRYFVYHYRSGSSAVAHAEVTAVYLPTAVVNNYAESDRIPHPTCTFFPAPVIIILQCTSESVCRGMKKNGFGCCFVCLVVCSLHRSMRKHV